MKHAFRLIRIILMLAVLALGWLLPGRAAAAGEGDGWFEENGDVFFLYNGQLLRNCFAEIDGEYFYFKEGGAMKEGADADV